MPDNILPITFPNADDGLYVLVGGVLTKVDTSGASVDDVLAWTGSGYALATPTGGGGGGGSPTPVSLSYTTNLAAWYRAANAVRTGSRVTSLPSDALASGAPTLAQATSALQPRYVPDGCNGLPALFFGADYLTVATAISALTDNWTMIVVVRPSYTFNSRKVYFTNGTLANGYALAQDNNFIGGLNPAVAWMTSTDEYQLETWQIITMSRSSGTTRFYRNGALLAFTSTSTPVAPSGGTWMGGMGSGDPANTYCGITDALFYTAALSDANRALVEGALATAYNIPAE